MKDVPIMGRDSLTTAGKIGPVVRSLILAIVAYYTAGALSVNR
jgi:hypothetical protein